MESKTENINEFLKMVKCFHKTFNAPVLDTPQIPSKERCDLRVRLIQEELDEMKEAIENNDIIELADSLMDQLYVVFGAILEFGLFEETTSLFKEVHASNMSKACINVDEANATIEYYKTQNVETYYVENDGSWLIYRKGDDKILKSINYTPVDFKKILKT